MFQMIKLELRNVVEAPLWGMDREKTDAEKKRDRFGTMFTLHQMLNRAGVSHENADSLPCSGYVRTKRRF